MPAHLCQRQAHAGQGHDQLVGQGDVVVADHGYVLARLQAFVAGGAHQANGEEVVDRKKCLRARVESQQVFALLVAGVAVKRTIEDPLRAQAEALLAVVADEAAGAISAGGRMPFARENRHVATAQSIQVLGRQPAAQFVVAGRRQVSGNLPADQHVGDVLARQQVEQGLGFTDVGVTDDQPGHRAAQGVFGTGHLAWLLVVGIGHEGEVAGLFGGAVDAVINGRHHQVSKARHEHADFLALAQFQVGGLGVRPIVQLLGQGADARHHLGRCRSLNPGRVAIEHP
ncbi:hypothetical protein D3C76_561840 [compost metagenome]